MDQSRKRRGRVMMGANATLGKYGAGEMKKKKKGGGKWKLLLLLLLLAALVAGVVLYAVRNTGRSGIGKTYRIGATLSQNVMPFDDSVIFYDGTTLHCVAATGGTLWSYQIGTNADYDVGEKRIVAWSGNDLHILTSKGRLIYTNTMSDTVQFASVGRDFVAVFIGEPDNGVVTVINGDGATVDNITVSGQTLLDIGFFMSTTSSSQQEAELMWMLGLNTSGTIISTELQTFQPGRLATGKSLLGEHIAYTIYDTAGTLNVVDTRKITRYNYRALESGAQTLIYGYTVSDVQKNGSSANVLLLPTKEQSVRRLTSVRLMSAGVDRVLHLPEECMNALLGTRAVYAFSQNAVYACKFGETTFKAYAMPMTVTAVLGMVSDNRAIVASGSEIYVVELPTQ